MGFGQTHGNTVSVPFRLWLAVRTKIENLHARIWSDDHVGMGCRWMVFRLCRRKNCGFFKGAEKKHPPFWRLQKLPPAVLEAPLIWACRFGVPFSLETSWLLAPEGRAWASHRIQEANGHMEESKSHGGVFVGAVHYPFWCAFPD